MNPYRYDMLVYTSVDHMLPVDNIHHTTYARLYKDIDSIVKAQCTNDNSIRIELPMIVNNVIKKHIDTIVCDLYNSMFIFDKAVIFTDKGIKLYKDGMSFKAVDTYTNEILKPLHGISDVYNTLDQIVTYVPRF